MLTYQQRDPFWAWPLWAWRGWEPFGRAYGPAWLSPTVASRE